MEIEIKGNKRTNSSFLKSLFKNSIFNNKIDPTCMEILNTFSGSTLTKENDKKFVLNLDEYKRKLNFGLKRCSINKTGVSIFGSLFIPNIFGDGEIIKFDVDLNKNVQVLFKKPLIFNTKFLQNCFLELKSYQRNDLISKKGFNFIGNGVSLQSISKKISFSLFYERITKGINKFWDSSKVFIVINKDLNDKNDKIAIETGFYRKKQSLMSNPYFKMVLSRHIFQKSIFNNILNFNSILESGVIFGKAHFSDRFFLGSKIPGYRKDSIGYYKGGKSHFSIYNTIGITVIKGIEIYGFYYSGLVSKQTNFFELFRSFVLANAVMPNIRNFGCSAGIGFRIPITSKIPQIDIKICKTFIENIGTKFFDISLEY